jgi:hypothetical protein
MIYSKTSGVMDMKKEGVQIGSRDFWFKVVDFLQQNQALIDSCLKIVLDEKII